MNGNSRSAWSTGSSVAARRSSAAQDGVPDRRHPFARPTLDVAEPTWEQAIVALAAKVRQTYGDHRAGVPRPRSGHSGIP
jgi:hypothetical protein